MDRKQAIHYERLFCRKEKSWYQDRVSSIHTARRSFIVPSSFVVTYNGMPCLICSWLQNSIRASAATAWALFLEENPTFSHSFPPLSHTDSGCNYFRLHIRQRQLQLYYFRLPRMHQKKKTTKIRRRRRILRSYHIFAKMFKSRRPFVVQSTGRASMQLNPQHKVLGSSEIADNSGDGGRRKCERHKTTTPVSLSLSLSLSLFLSRCVHCPLIKLKFCPQYCPSLQWNRY